MQTFGNRLEYARQRAGLSQTDLARRVGVSQQAVGKWIADETAPQPARVVAIAGALAVAPEWLLFGSGAPPDTLAGDLTREPAARYALRLLPANDPLGRLRDACVELSALSAQAADVLRAQRRARGDVESHLVEVIAAGASKWGWEITLNDRRADLVLVRNGDQVQVDILATVLHPPAHGVGDVLVRLPVPAAMRETNAAGGHWVAWPLLLGDDQVRVLTLPVARLGSLVVVSWEAPERPTIRLGGGEVLELAQYLDQFSFDPLA